MTCPRCGAPTVPGGRFCFACGSPLAVLPPGDAGTERRVVTVLFGDLSDFTSWAEDLDPERVGLVTDRVLASLAGIVGQYGGHVDKLTGDGIMAVFGAPTAHEDDAERAVRAAARMQQVVRRLVEEESGGGRRLGLRVGLNTGEVVAGVQAALSYTVVGDTVNTASRLSDAAGVGAVYAGRDTAGSTVGAASWRTLSPLRLKGKRELVPAYELVALRPAGATRHGLGDEAPFVGRDAELGRLIGRLLDVAERGVPRSALVTGEAGVGKTRLAEELARFAGELPGGRVLWGRCAPYGEGRDLAAVAEMVRTACGIGEQDDVATARTRVARTIARLDLRQVPGAEPSAVAERLRAMLGLEQLDLTGPRDAVMPGVAVGGDLVRQALASLFSALAAEGPLVLVLDDVHWATDTMLEGLRDVASQVSGQLLLLALGRPELLVVAGEDHWTGRLPGFEHLALAPLDDAALERLLSAYLGVPVAAVDDRVRDALLGRAQGNPFYLAELLHLLVDRGVLRRLGARWELDGELPDDLLPAGVQAVLAARIDGLDGAAKGVLRDASVLGLRMTPQSLAAVGGASGHGDPAGVAAALRTLLDRRLLSDSDGVLRFEHTLVRDVAYAGLAKAERARRHAAAAAWAGGPGGGRSGETDTAVANQGERAVRLALEMGLPPTDPSWQARGPAFTAFARIGSAALARDDFRAAEAVLGRALRLAGPPYGDPLAADLVLPVRVAHARSLAGLHRLAPAERVLAPALDTGDDGLRAGALVVLGDVRRQRGDRAGAREAFVSALAAAGAAGIDRLGGEALRQLGLLDYFDGRLRAAEERFRQAHALAVGAGDLRGAGWALQHLAWSATTRGDYLRAEQTLQLAAEVFTILDDTGGLSWVAGTEAFVRLLQGRYAEARQLATSVPLTGQAAGERWVVGALRTIDALAAAELGDVEHAAAQAARALERFAEVGDSWGQVLALTAAAAAARGADEPDRAVALSQEAVELAGRAGHPVGAGLALVVAGYAYLDQGDLSGAEGAAWRSGALLAGLDLEPHATLGAQVLLAQVLRRGGAADRALRVLDDALAAAGAEGLLFPRRQALAHRAGTLLELGRPAEALAAAEQAVSHPGEDVRSRVLALRALGSALRACGQAGRAQAVLLAALEAARSTGQRSEIAATERLLARDPP